MQRVPDLPFDGRDALGDRSPFAEHADGLVHLAAPDQRPDARHRRVHPEDLQRAHGELARGDLLHPVDLAELEEGFDHVVREDRAGRPLHAERARVRDAGFGDLDGLAEAPEHVQAVGIVDPVAQLGVMVGRVLPGQAEVGEAGLDLAEMDPAAAAQVRGDRHDVVEADRLRHPERLVGGRDGLLQPRSDEVAPREIAQQCGSQPLLPRFGLDDRDRLEEQVGGPAATEVLQVERLVAQQPCVHRGSTTAGSISSSASETTASARSPSPLLRRMDPT